MFMAKRRIIQVMMIEAIALIQDRMEVCQVVAPVLSVAVPVVIESRH